MKRNRSTKDQKRYEVLREMLEDRRREIHDKLRSLRETLPAEAELVKDAEEQSVDDFVQEVDFALMQMKSETLLKIDEAIKRLDHGTYGICADCGVEISEARLAALPFAARCRHCQEHEEELSAPEREEPLFTTETSKAYS
jgi:DnaK suppressor protein